MNGLFLCVNINWVIFEQKQILTSFKSFKLFFETILYFNLINGLNAITAT